jgi:hypothetical protein
MQYVESPILLPEIPPFLHPMIQVGASITSIGRTPIEKFSIYDSESSSSSSIEYSPTCSTCLKKGILKRCSKCKKVFYCSKECQKKDWNFHKTICKKH